MAGSAIALFSSAALMTVQSPGIDPLNEGLYQTGGYVFGATVGGLAGSAVLSGYYLFSMRPYMKYKFDLTN
jgi:hypothetical protein